MNQSANNRMNAISEQGLCAGCGICQSVAGPDKIKVVKSVNGYERPVIVGDLDDVTVERILGLSLKFSLSVHVWENLQRSILSKVAPKSHY